MGYISKIYTNETSLLEYQGPWRTTMENRKRGRLRQEMHRHVIEGQIDCLVLHEHHLSKAKAENYGSTMYGDWDHFWGQGYGTEENT